METVTDSVTRRPKGRWRVRVPRGSLVSLGRYIAAWKALKQLPSGASIAGWDHFPTPASDVLRRMREGLHDRINRRLPWYGQGRKWDAQWQVETMRLAFRVNTMRLLVWEREVPKEFRARLEHRITRAWEE